MDSIAVPIAVLNCMVIGTVAAVILGAPPIPPQISGGGEQQHVVLLPRNQQWKRANGAAKANESDGTNVPQDEQDGQDKQGGQDIKQEESTATAGKRNVTGGNKTPKPILKTQQDAASEGGADVDKWKSLVSGDLISWLDDPENYKRDYAVQLPQGFTPTDPMKRAYSEVVVNGDLPTTNQISLQHYVQVMSRLAAQTTFINHIFGYTVTVTARVEGEQLVFTFGHSIRSSRDKAYTEEDAAKASVISRQHIDDMRTRIEHEFSRFGDQLVIFKPEKSHISIGINITHAQFTPCVRYMMELLHTIDEIARSTLLR
jgi:hypothetical protein